MRGLPTYYEFFAGGGMARAGLGVGWRPLFANDLDPMKAAAYAANWGAEGLVRGDVATLAPADLPGRADLAWASFPCQDLSLAGGGAGLGTAEAEVGTRSGTFWPFWRLMRALRDERRAPRLIVLENVPGMLRSHGGRDFAAVGTALAEGGYFFGALVIDARRFVPQSRARVFFVGFDAGRPVPDGLIGRGPSAAWHPKALVEAQAGLGEAARRGWVWLDPPQPEGRVDGLGDLIQENPADVRWHDPAETGRLVAMMSPVNLAKLEAARQAGGRRVGFVYKRTRRDAQGNRLQRAEVRFDEVAGCLRTPSGGSSRQTILVVEEERVRSRLLSGREAARLMGLPESYRLPTGYNDAYHVVGDGLCVPAVRFLTVEVLEPILFGKARRGSVAAE
jgi:DNA (cytosine-5)-methyltransferase 1